MPRIDFSTQNKVCIRTNYNKPIIKHLKESMGTTLFILDYLLRRRTISSLG
jgi:hypothetical protein